MDNLEEEWKAQNLRQTKVFTRLKGDNYILINSYLMVSFVRKNLDAKCVLQTVSASNNKTLKGCFDGTF